MIRSSRGRIAPRRILIATAAALAPLIAGCEAGSNAPSLHWHPPTNGTFYAVSNNITISNAFVLGAPIRKVLGQGQNAGLFLSLVNAGRPADRLVSISAHVGQSVQIPVAQSVQIPVGGVRLPPKHRILLAGPAPTVLLRNLTRPLRGGSVIWITLTFAKASPATIPVPVMPRATFYTTYSPAPGPSSVPPTTSPKGHGARVSGSPTPSPTGSP